MLTPFKVRRFIEWHKLMFVIYRFKGISVKAYDRVVLPTLMKCCCPCQNGYGRVAVEFLEVGYMRRATQHHFGKDDQLYSVTCFPHHTDCFNDELFRHAKWLCTLPLQSSRPSRSEERRVGKESSSL